MTRPRSPATGANARDRTPARPPSPRRLARTACLLPALLLLAACGSGSGDDPDAERPTTEVPAPTPDPDALPRVDVRAIDEIYPFRRNGRHANVLARCALIEDVREACSLDTLPFIAQESASPTIEDVMARVLVTHDWMGERLETLLERRGADLLPLFGSVTSITIGSTVRPSNYWTGTGGIQLDPAGLWTTLEEKANVSVAEDFRSAFAARLAFRNYWTMRVDGESIFSRFGLEDRNERSFEAIERPTMSLLLHELAHAVDYLPPNSAALLDSSLTPNEALGLIEGFRLSSNLTARLPLNSTLLSGLANVRYRDNEPSDRQRAVPGSVAGGEMAVDGASHFYSYSTIREDFANLFETLQMKRLYDADVHVAFTVQPDDLESFSCDELLVEWGVLNRLGNPTVALRARDAVEAIYGPDPTLDDFMRLQGNTERLMETGIDWCTNLDRARPATVAAARSRRPADPSLVPGSEPSHAERHAIAEARRTP